MTRRRISIFGATGSIGQNTIDLIKRDLEAYHTVALTGAHNIPQLAHDAIKLRAEVAVTADTDRLQDLRDALSGSGIEAAAGESGLEEAASRSADWVMSAIVGAAGLKPGLRALESGANLALANKESLVCAGELIRATAKKHDALLIPVDSEHSAVFQALVGEDMTSVERIIITGSGGAFRDWPIGDLPFATPEQAATHPNWAMGQRITIDSATMFNKALELIETKEYFGVEDEKIEVIIHPESIIHALVGFVDGALMAHVGPPDMRHAIGYALHWPERRNLPVERLDLAQVAQFNFYEPDLTRYPPLRLARDVIRSGGLTGAVFNAAKESALDAFIDKKIGFMDMAAVVEDVLSISETRGNLLDEEMTLESVMNADAEARIAARQVITQRYG
ncbi:MAG: 1-deoxy-D-xylulose-5-phosphate reductoisomerase [Aestuariivita sp.]|nr:1-deoxy-D-xylulose-5-phosphate reductoisomerase [Aestuariivita sp.]MCY4345977.1 1-deoxy-D-xylulose-5-phosphate reductoisomerase [Aestuariivita sp.]